MAKSADNFLTLQNALINEGLEPLAYRFAALQVNYRKPMEYSDANLAQAAEGLKSLYSQFKALEGAAGTGTVNQNLKDKFLAAINDDLNMPKALAAVALVFKAQISPADKRATILDFDKVLGLSLEKAGEKSGEELMLADLPDSLRDLIQRRQSAREVKEWELADNLRKRIEEKGYIMEDTKDGYKLSRQK
jgi:cysteinyl-tRNA synthetase